MWSWRVMLYEGASCEIVISSSYKSPALNWLWLVYDANWYDHVLRLWFLYPAPPPSFASSKCCSKQAINLPDSGESWCEAKVQRPSTVVKMKSNNDDAAVVILVFQVTQWKLAAGMLAGFGFPHRRSTSQRVNTPGFLAFLPLTEDPLILGPCIK